MANKSKNKGSAWERDICKFLSNLYDDNFERVPYSGAFIGGKNSVRKQNLTENQTKTFKGDILPPDHWNRFNCEAKNYAAFPFHRLLYDVPVPQLEDWLAQIHETSDEGDVNILFMKITRVGKFIAFESFQPFTTDRHISYTDKSGHEWKLTEFDSFFKLNSSKFEEVNTK